MIYKKLLTTLLILSVTTFIQASEIKMMTENYPPYNMEVDGKLQGLSVDVVEAMLKQMGSKKNKYDIELLSWSKAYDSAKNNKNNMVILLIWLQTGSCNAQTRFLNQVARPCNDAIDAATGGAGSTGGAPKDHWCPFDQD